MKKIMCKRLVLLWTVVVLCVCANTLVYGEEQDVLAEKTSVMNAPVGMQAIDISQQAVKEAEIPEEQIVLEHNISAESVSANNPGELIPVSEEAAVEKATYVMTEDAADYVRQKMVARENTISFVIANSGDMAYTDVQEDIPEKVALILNEVFEYDINGEPEEGDYLFWHVKGYKWKGYWTENHDIKLCFVFEYRTDYDEEKYVTKKVNAIVKKLDLKSSSLNEYEKVRAIYDYIMKRIEYDYEHYYYDQSYNYMYTTYGALSEGTAVCQAYATLFYRLCEEAGISARVICGNNDEYGNPTHGWNIVKIGGFYYNLDVTWDDAEVPTHIYFLKNNKEFTGHARNKSYRGSAFNTQFPMTLASYVLPESKATQKLLNLPNITGNIELTNGEWYSITAQKKIKILYFMTPAENAWGSLLKEFYNLSTVKSGKYDVLITDIFMSYDSYPGKREEYMATIMDTTDNPSAYNYSNDYINGRMCLKQYTEMVGTDPIARASVVVIDEAGQIRYFGTGLEGIRKLDGVIAKIQTETDRQVTGVKVKQTKNNQVKISWDKFGENSKYRVYRKVSGGKYYCLGATKKTSFTDIVSPTKKYTYQVFIVKSGADVAGSKKVSIKTKVKLLKKGKTYTVDGYKYTVLKSTSKTKTVAFKGVSDKTLTKVIIPSSVKINGLKYKVTEIAAGALSGNKKIKTVSIGSNITKIGSKAFYKASKLKCIVVKSKKINRVGSKALTGISAKAEIRVPAAKLKKYKSLFKGKGQKSSVKIKK